MAFCNLKAKCLFINNECDSIDNKQLSITNLITKFDKKHEIKHRLMIYLEINEKL